MGRRGTWRRRAGRAAYRVGTASPGVRRDLAHKKNSKMRHSLRRRGRQAEHEASAAPGQVISGEAAAVLFGDALGDGQPETHPCLLAAHEGLEHLGENV